MNTLTIIFDDKTVGIDGEFYAPVDVSSAPNGLHALQWNGNFGWIEFSVNIDGSKPANEKITTLPDWVALIQESFGVAKQLAASQPKI